MSNSRGAYIQTFHVVCGELFEERLRVFEENGYTTIRTDNVAAEKYYGEVQLSFKNDFAKALGEALIKASSGE